MNLKIIVFIFSLFEISLFCTANIVYNDFQLLDHNTVEFFNSHLANGKLKFSFEGANFTRLEHKSDSVWILNLFNDVKNSVSIYKRSFAPSNTTRFRVSWFHYDKNGTEKKEVCFDYGHNNSTWFSTFLEKEQPWPMNGGKPIASALPLMTGSYGTAQFGPVVERLFFNTDGFAIVLARDTPLYVRRTADHRLCYQVKPNHTPSRVEKYTISEVAFDLIASENIQQVRDECVHRFGFIRKPYRNETPDERMFQLPMFNLDVKLLNQSEVLQKAQEVQRHGFKSGQLVLTNWEAHLGDLEFDKSRFHAPKDLISEIHKLGFVIKLQVNSFVSNQSAVFHNHGDYLIKEKVGSNRPFTFNWTSHGIGGIIEYLDRYYARHYVTDNLTRLHKELGIDSFQFVGGELGMFNVSDKLFGELPHLQHYPNLFTRSFVGAAQQLGKMIEVDAGYETQPWPIFVRMPDVEPDWTGLRSIITTALTMSIAGYSYITPAVLKPGPNGTKPSAELYIRWVQACTFFPSMQLSPLPWTYTDNVVNITRKYMDLHKTHSTAIRDMAKQSSEHGTPLFRPLWYLSPNDAHTHAVWDQFALGNDLVVAPVLEPGQLKRTVYLPSGNWIDQHGQSYAGPKHFQIVTPLEELAYFQRKL